jgi:phosphoglycolate phosphatase-like HAD superfamily hydrolase
MPAEPAHPLEVATMARFAAVVFDFDGTLVQSAAAKREAYFTLFAATPAHAAIIARILAASPDGTRFSLIPQMLAAIAGAGLDLPHEATPEALIAAYGERVLAAVMAAPEMPGATALLRALAGRCHVSICSNTPHEPLQELVAARGWSGLIDAAVGIPTSKTAHIAGLMARRGLRPEQVVMIGDGDNDAAAARANACVFRRIAATGDLARIAAELGADHVPG